MGLIKVFKNIIDFKIKTRIDSPYDQFSRLVMSKVLLVSAVIMFIHYYNDTIYCVRRSSYALSSAFVDKACWISGFFIYEEMTNMTAGTYHYGIPNSLNQNGIDSWNGELCSHKKKWASETCQPMTRIIYTHYQWLPFYIGALAFLFYFPYILFRIVNVDLVSLKSAMISNSADPDQLVKNYFNYEMNPVLYLRLRVILNVFVKCFYFAVNLFAFYFTDYLLYNKFANYGSEFYEWGKRTNLKKSKLFPLEVRVRHPGEKLLPSTGLCYVHESVSDHKTHIRNVYLYLCEFSMNIAYQYILIGLWFMFIVSITISAMGLVANITGYLFPILFHTFGRQKFNFLHYRRSYRYLTLREIDYLQFIRCKDMVLYGEIMDRLKMKLSNRSANVDNDSTPMLPEHDLIDESRSSSTMELHRFK